jgi:hypothetical protein
MGMKEKERRSHLGSPRQSLSSKLQFNNICHFKRVLCQCTSILRLYTRLTRLTRPLVTRILVYNLATTLRLTSKIS